MKATAIILPLRLMEAIMASIVFGVRPLPEKEDPSTKWERRSGLVGMMIGFALSLAGGLIWIGEWKSRQEMKIEDQAGDIQELKTYVPRIIGMEHDISYLAERARREDDRQEHRR